MGKMFHVEHFYLSRWLSQDDNPMMFHVEHYGSCWSVTKPGLLPGSWILLVASEEADSDNVTSQPFGATLGLEAMSARSILSTARSVTAAKF